MLQDNIELVLNPKVMIKKQETRFYLYNMDTEYVLELNAIGMEIAEKIQKKISLNDLALYFSKKYDVSIDEVLADINGYIEMCIEKGFFIKV